MLLSLLGQFLVADFGFAIRHVDADFGGKAAAAVKSGADFARLAEAY